MSNPPPVSPAPTETENSLNLTKTVSAASNASHKRAKVFRQQTQRELEKREKDPLAGNFNHLTPDQQKAAEEFHRVLAEKGLYRLATENEGPSHDETTMLRFLRARKFDVAGAVAQFSDTEQWRKDTQIEKLYDTIDVDEYEEARSLYPQWTGRRDKRGIPMYVYEVAPLNSKTMSNYMKSTSKTRSAPPGASSKTPERLLRLFALYENMTQFVLPLVSTLERPNPETPIACTNNIVDINGVGLKQFWNLKSHMQDASTLATAHYPETLDRIFIIGAPSFFPTVWGWIKRWFDPVTVSKIFILAPNEVLPTLEKHIDIENIPKKYGGKLEWKFGEEPIPDDQTQAVLGDLTHDGWVRGPLRWVGGDHEGDAKVVAVGTVNGKPRKSVVTIPEHLPVHDVIATETGIVPANLADTEGTKDAKINGSNKSKASYSAAGKKEDDYALSQPGVMSPVHIKSPDPAKQQENESSVPNGAVPDTINQKMETLAV